MHEHENNDKALVTEVTAITDSPDVDSAIKFTMRQKDAPFTDRLNFVLDAVDASQ